MFAVCWDLLPSETFLRTPGMSLSGRLCPLPVSSINRIRGELKGRLPTVPGRLENNYLITCCPLETDQAYTFQIVTWSVISSVTIQRRKWRLLVLPVLWDSGLNPPSTCPISSCRWLAWILPLPLCVSGRNVLRVVFMEHGYYSSPYECIKYTFGQTEWFTVNRVSVDAELPSTQNRHF